MSQPPLKSINVSHTATLDGQKDRVRYRINEALNHIEAADEADPTECLRHIARATVELNIAIELATAIYNLRK